MGPTRWKAQASQRANTVPLLWDAIENIIGKAVSFLLEGLARLGKCRRSQPLSTSNNIFRPLFNAYISEGVAAASFRLALRIRGGSSMSHENRVRVLITLAVFLCAISLTLVSR